MGSGHGGVYPESDGCYIDVDVDLDVGIDAKYSIQVAIQYTDMQLLSYL